MGLKRVEFILSASFSSERRNFCCPLFRASGTVPGLILCSLAQLCPAFRICSPPGFSVHGITPGKNTGVGCRSLLQGIFPTQGWNPGLLYCRQILYHQSHQNLGACQCKSVGLISESGRSPGRGHDNPLQDSCLGNPMDRGA